MFLIGEPHAIVSTAERSPSAGVYLLRASDDGVEGVTARHVIAYAILLAALALVVGWRVLSGRARHRHRSRDDRIDLFHEDE